jgi:hypothetical protein
VADPDRVADVLERVRADRDVELVVGERPRLVVADVAHDPGVLGEALGGRVAEVAVVAAGGVGLQVEHPVGARHRLGPAADVEDRASARRR